MTPGARCAAAIEILDGHLRGEPAEKVLTNWARRNRFAGSGDRAAIRDLVFAALRNKQSFAALGGQMSGRGLILGQLRAQGTNPVEMFSGEGYSPSKLSQAEISHALPVMDDATKLDCPLWLMDDLQRSLSADFHDVMQCLKSRAPVFLRVHLQRVSRTEAQRALLDAGIETEICNLSPSALKVTLNERRVGGSDPYQNGLVEIQDAASQWVSDHVPISEGGTVLDYCAGGGGKTLAMAARANAQYFAHDRFPDRMSDLPKRAARAGAQVKIVSHGELTARAPFDTILCDVPCSGSGAWRRSPEGKWSLDDNKLKAILKAQSEILDQAAALVSDKGVLAYATCSLLDCENGDQVRSFMRRSPGWACEFERGLTPLDGGDGFYLAILTRT